MATLDLAAFSPRRLAARVTAGIDWPLFAIAIALSALGLATLYSASYDQPARVTAQLANLGVAVVAMWLVSRIPPQTLMRFAPPAYLFGVALLVAVALYGDVVNNARRWLHVGVTRFQPSEMMKLALPLMLAWYFHHRDHSLFVVFAPLESPKIALMVIVENGGFGARAAAPIARTVLDYYLLGKAPGGAAAPGGAKPGAAEPEGEDTD